MNPFLTVRSKDLPMVARNLGFRNLVRVGARNLLDQNHYFILEIKLNGKLTRPQVSLPGLETGLLRESDLASFENQFSSMSDYDRKELMSRILFFRNGFTNCHILRLNGSIAYLQWIISPKENELIRQKYSGRFLQLKEGQVMLENSFTFPRFRGFGVMYFGTMELLLKYRDQGYHSAMCYVIKENVPALNQLLQMGFRIRRIIREYKVFGHVWRDL